MDSLRRVVRGQGKRALCVFGVRENLGITREMSVSSGFDYECILTCVTALNCSSTLETISLCVLY